MEIKILNNISTKEKFSIIIIIGAFLLMLIVPLATVMIYTSESNKRDLEQKKEVYLWDNESIKKAKLAENLDDPEDGSIKAHLLLFHKLFWSSEPYSEFIEDNHEMAFKMGDKSIRILKRMLDKKSYFQTNIAGGYHIIPKIQPDKIEIDYTSKPYKFTVIGILKVIRNNDIVLKNIKATGTIRTKREEEKEVMEKSHFESWFIQDYNIIDFSVKEILKQNQL